MSHEIGWIIFGKLPTILILCTALYVCARRVGPLLAAWSFAAFFVTLSIGATVFPSILGALAGGSLSLLFTLRLLSKQTKLWRATIWPLVSSFVALIMVGRIGCWLSGCCFGEVSHLPWATQYTDELTINIYHAQRYGDLAQHGPLAVHPVQLYESLGAMLLLFVFSGFKKRLGEVSAAFLLLTSYLSLYGALNPLRAYLNTPSSLIQWGLFSKLQWILFTLGMISVVMALRNLKTTHNSLVHTKAPSHYNQFFKSGSVIKLVIIWSLLACIGSLSLYIGTPFSAQLSMIGLCLSTAVFIESLEQQGKLKINLSLTVLRPILPQVFNQVLNTANLSLSSRSLLLLLLLPLCLIPLSLRSIATPGLGSLPSGKNWVYQMDDSSKKLVRIGRVQDLINPQTAIEIDMDAEAVGETKDGNKIFAPNRRKPKIKPQKRKLSISLGRSKQSFENEYEIIEGGDSCSGPDSVVTYNNKQTRSFDMAVVSYDLPQLSSGNTHRMLASWYHEQVSGTRSVNFDYDSSNSTEEETFADLMHIGLGYEFNSDFIRGGIGLENTWGSTSETFTKGDYETDKLPVRPIGLLGFGYKYLYLEGGTGPVWGAPGVGNVFFSLGIYVPINDDFQAMARFGRALLGPDSINIFSGQVGVMIKGFEIKVNFGETGGPSGAQFGYGITL